MADRFELKSQQFAKHTCKQQAVCVRGAHKHYGTKKNPVVILDGLNMTVPKGTIYGLLGASGCGKSTLLSCIVGRKRLNSGEIWVLGGTPGSRASGVPGPRIGYMPQEIALYPSFTVRETLTFFSWIANADTTSLQERVDFLVELLMLPNADQTVATLSGGQQRRVSFAAALVHKPELMILDEPTVGLDPLLRKNIWDYLLEITQTENTTIIITTHYIDETRQAHLIGLMRGGYFLAEESPDKLLARFSVETLEEAFLKLSLLQNLKRSPSGTVQRATNSKDDVDTHSQDIENVSQESEHVTPVRDRSAKHYTGDVAPIDNFQTPLPPKDSSPKLVEHVCFLQKHHMQALIWKYWLWMRRNIHILAFTLGLPLFQISFFCLCIGRNPSNLPVAVINYETNNSAHCDGIVQCNSSHLSCSYLGYLGKNALRLIYYDSEESATNSVLSGKTYASIVIKTNYSQALQRRIKSWRGTRSWDIEHSEIEVMQDTAVISIAYYVKAYLYQTFLKFVQDYLESCNFNKRALPLPVTIQPPIYGLTEPNFTDFATPGIMLTYSIIFFLALALTAGAMMIERNEGGLERSLVAGVTEAEMLSAHLICQFVIMVLQAIIVMICAFAMFGMTHKGSLALSGSLLLLTGLCGMCFGFVISCACDSERMATFLAMGSLLPMMLLSGIIWPIEAMHHVLQKVAFVLPFTKATESMRSILQRSWRISERVVYIGFISLSIWIVVFLTISFLILKFKKG